MRAAATASGEGERCSDKGAETEAFHCGSPCTLTFVSVTVTLIGALRPSLDDTVTVAVPPFTAVTVTVLLETDAVATPVLELVALNVHAHCVGSVIVEAAVCPTAVSVTLDGETVNATGDGDAVGTGVGVGASKGVVLVVALQLARNALTSNKAAAARPRPRVVRDFITETSYNQKE